MLVTAAALLGFFAVALGAFGAHGLKDSFTPESLGWWETATLYALVHVAAALAVGLLGSTGLRSLGGWALVIGAVIFAGTLYAMALGAPRWFGAITPIGGVTLLAGWAMIAVSGLRQ